MLHIGSDSEFVEISELERAPIGSPTEGDVRVLVSVRLGDFGGKYDSVWLQDLALQEFVLKLAALEENRIGSATLTSTSPDEFKITIRSRDKLGHFVVEASLARFQYSGPTYWHTSVAGGFELEPSALPAIVRSFREIHAQNG